MFGWMFKFEKPVEVMVTDRIKEWAEDMMIQHGGDLFTESNWDYETVWNWTIVKFEEEFGLNHEDVPNATDTIHNIISQHV